MARPDNAYSRAITILKIVLPLIALGILSTLFLLSRPSMVGEPLPYSDLELGEISREQRLGQPVYTGVSESGAELRLSAEAMTPDKDQTGVYLGTQLMAEVTRRDGSGFDATAPTGRLDEKARRASFQGGVRIETLDGYTALTESAWLATNLSRLETDGAVTANGPIGELAAGKLILSTQDQDEGGMVALFTDGVRLIYHPQKTETP